ncbi:6-carboxytetrahydropterin synthase QueD [Candidatus Peregrinibacteria bacterium CG_4_9_14_0_2_um_filter_53_11]|nr:MAG: 6-carboxytetrahydropterin synthase QueD [Candidatus Peregrinibacteria bacterium CG_4_9_14_0_2_um_filter_53_11]
MFLSRIFSFSAAHHLTNYHGACERPHGHTYRLKITVEGEIRPDGLILDFVELKRVVNERVLEKLDHTDLNDRFENPSAELITEWIAEQLSPIGELTKTQVRLAEIELWEGDTTSVRKVIS